MGQVFFGGTPPKEHVTVFRFARNSRYYGVMAYLSSIITVSSSLVIPSDTRDTTYQCLASTITVMNIPNSHFDTTSCAGVSTPHDPFVKGSTQNHISEYVPILGSSLFCKDSLNIPCLPLLGGVSYFLMKWLSMN